MVILKWVQSVLLGPSEAAKGNSTQPVGRSSPKEAEFIDIAHEVMRSDAQELSGIVNAGQSSEKRRRLKEKIKGKVKQNIARGFDGDDVVEEVTERILDAAEFDPYYREMFGEKE